MSLPHASTCGCHECQQKRTPEVVAEFTGFESQPLPTEQDTSKVTHSFTETIEKADSTGRLSQTWRECLKIHDDNALLRANLLQMQVAVQAQLNDWAQVRDDMAKILEDIRDSKCTDKYMEKYKFAMAMNGKAVDMMTQIQTCIRDLKKEIRMTEFQSRFFVHVNLIQMLLTGVTGILFKHLQSNEKKNMIVKEIGGLAKMFLQMENKHRQAEDGE